MNWENAMSTMIACQQDMHEMVSRWKDMIVNVPMDVTFEFFDNTMYTIPNLAKIASLAIQNDLTAATDELTWDYQDGQWVTVHMPSTYPIKTNIELPDNGYINGLIIPYYTAEWIEANTLNELIDAVLHGTSDDLAGQLRGDPSDRLDAIQGVPSGRLGLLSLKDFTSKTVTASRFGVTANYEDPLEGKGANPRYYPEELLTDEDNEESDEEKEDMRPPCVGPKLDHDITFYWDSIGDNRGGRLSVNSRFSTIHRIWRTNFNLNTVLPGKVFDPYTPPNTRTGDLIPRTYYNGDIVIYQDKFYRCVREEDIALTNSPPDKSTAWELWGQDYKDTHNLLITLNGFQLWLPFRTYSPFQGFGTLSDLTWHASPIISLENKKITGTARVLENTESTYGGIIDTARKSTKEMPLSSHFTNNSVIDIKFTVPIPVCRYEKNAQLADVKDIPVNISCKDLLSSYGQGLIDDSEQEGTSLKKQLTEWVAKERTVTYVIDDPAMGTIVGANLRVTDEYDESTGRNKRVARQKVIEGQNSCLVAVVVNEGYEFSKWQRIWRERDPNDSDKWIETPIDVGTDVRRQELSVMEDLVFVAVILEKKPETVILGYVVNPAGVGQILGKPVQSIDYEGDGEPVSVVGIAKYAKEYYFEQWDDGVISLTRQDKNVTSTRVITAIFRNIAEVGRINNNDLRLFLHAGNNFDLDNGPQDILNVADCGGLFMLRLRVLPKYSNCIVKLEAELIRELSTAIMDSEDALSNSMNNQFPHDAVITGDKGGDVTRQFSLSLALQEYLQKADSPLQVKFSYTITSAGGGIDKGFISALIQNIPSLEK